MPSAASTPRRTQAERTADARDRLIRAAVKVFAERGYARSSLALIGREAGVSRGLASFHFGSKAGLLEAAAEWVVAQAQDAFAAEDVMAKRGLDAVRALLRGQAVALRANPDAYRMRERLLFESWAEHDVDLEPLARRSRENELALARRLLDQAVDRGEARADLDAEAIGTWALASVRGIRLQWFADPEGTDVDGAFMSLADAIEALVRP